MAFWCGFPSFKYFLTVISEDADVRMGRKDKECGAIGVMSVAGTSGETWCEQR